MATAKQVKGYIEQHPLVKECLLKGIVNFSELSRQIISANSLAKTDFDAVLVAVRRYAEKTKGRKDSEKAIVELFKKSKLEIKTKVCAIVLDNSASFSFIVKIIQEINALQEPCHLIQGTKAITLVVPEEFLEKIEKTFVGKIISKKKKLVEIVLHSPPEIENAPGFVAFVYGLLLEHGVNIVETMSCWTDTLLVIEEKDLAKAMSALQL